MRCMPVLLDVIVEPIGGLEATTVETIAVPIVSVLIIFIVCIVVLVKVFSKNKPKSDSDEHLFDAHSDDPVKLDDEL